MATVSNVRWGAATTLAATSGTAHITPAFPTAGNAPVAGDLLVIVDRAWRNRTNSNPYTQTIDPAAYPGWSALPDETTPQGGTGGGGLAANVIRYKIFYARYDPTGQNGVTGPPQVKYPASGTSGVATDTHTAQMCVVTGAQASDDPFSQTSALTVASANSTTALGPAPAPPSPVAAGSLVIATVNHEYIRSSGSVATMSGDGLTWTESAEGNTNFCWSTDWAITPLTPATTTVTAKTAAATIGTSGRGCGKMLVVAPQPAVSSPPPRVDTHRRAMSLLAR